jgi:hypothetical protein
MKEVNMPRKKSKPLPPYDEHSLPGPVRPEAITEELEMMRYVEKETEDEKVLFLEKVKSEQVFDTCMDIWNIHTDKNQYWVITNPAGLYAQTQFPSFDYALTFHVGLTYRIASDHRADEAEKEQDQLVVPWRRWEHAVTVLDRSTQAEEFQAIGILCRECLLSFVKVVVSDEMVPVSQERPRITDFLHWAELIANSIAQGPGAEEVRTYLKTISQAAWQLVNWLARETNAAKLDAHMALEATEYLLMAFGAALHRHRNS